jgi:hypothetical protein
MKKGGFYPSSNQRSSVVLLIAYEIRTKDPTPMKVKRIS